MLWTVRHRWPAGAHFAFNQYRHWGQLLLRPPGKELVNILRSDGVAQGKLLSIILYGITLVPLTDNLMEVDPELLVTFYANDASFNALSGRIKWLLTLLLGKGEAQGYFLEPEKSLFIFDSPSQEGVAKKAFEAKGMAINVVPGSQCHGTYVVLQD